MADMLFLDVWLLLFMTLVIVAGQILPALVRVASSLCQVYIDQQFRLKT